MKVKDLIKQLQKLPQNLQVYRADHDHGRFETAGTIGRAELIDKKDMDEFENDGDDDCFKTTPQKYVLLRPL